MVKHTRYGILAR